MAKKQVSKVAVDKQLASADRVDPVKQKVDAPVAPMDVEAAKKLKAKSGYTQFEIVDGTERVLENNESPDIDSAAGEVFDLNKRISPKVAK